MLGLGWAATPAGLKAMEELSKLEVERRAAGGRRYPAVPKGVASDEMCVPDPEYLVAAVDSDQCGCLSEPVWKCESDGNCGACDSGDGGEYAGGGGIL